MILFPSDNQEYPAAADGSNVDMTCYHRHREKAMIGRSAISFDSVSAS